jgi:hypothetical protein
MKQKLDSLNVLNVTILGENIEVIFMIDSRRKCFKEKFVKDLSFSDFKVAAIGTVIGKQEKGFLLSDGTGEVYVNVSNMEEGVMVGDTDFVRVFGRLMPFDEGFELQVEIVQNMKGIDKGALNKLREAVFK